MNPRLYNVKELTLMEPLMQASHPEFPLQWNEQWLTFSKYTVEIIYADRYTSWVEVA